MKLDKLKSLFKQLKKNLKKSEPINELGICGVILSMFENNEISYEEKEEMYRYLTSQKPTPDNKYKDFISEYWRGTDGGYWWTCMYKEPKTKEIRLNFLNALINNIK